MKIFFKLHRISNLLADVRAWWMEYRFATESIPDQKQKPP